MSELDYCIGGTFTSDGATKVLNIRADLDYMKVMNYTQLASASSTDRGVMWEWYRGFADGYGMEYKVTDNSNNILNGTIVTSGGFTLINSVDDAQLGSANSTITAISTASTPVVSLTSTSGLSSGDIVRLYNVAGAQQLGGIDFTIGSVVANTSFTLAYMSQLGGAGTTGSLRRVNFNPQFYPRQRYISAITKASSAVITMTVAHGYNVGDIVSFRVPSAYGMVEMDGLYGEITATATSTITVDINSSNFTTFAFPATAAVPFSPALVVPVGQAPSLDLNGTADGATVDTGYIGMQLGAGVDGPAGQSSDVIYWQAIKFYDGVQS